MARTASGKEQVKMARVAIRAAKMADELRAAQAVLLPLECGLSMAQTAVAIGRSVLSWRDLHYAYALFQNCPSGDRRSCEQETIT